SIRLYGKNTSRVFPSSAVQLVSYSNWETPAQSTAHFHKTTINISNLAYRLTDNPATMTPVSRSAMSDLFFSLILSLSPLFFTSVLVHSSTLPSDIAALQAFKSSIKPTSIPSYSCLATWNFSSDPCAGAGARAAARVTHLTLDPAGYSGSLSPLVSKLTQLVVLDLSDNNFSGPIPASLSSLYNLQTLVIRSNSFSGSFPPSVSGLKSLQILDISRNSISGILPNTLNGLTSLQRLDLSFNKFTGSLPKLPFGLIELAAKANSLSGSLDKSSFDGLTQIEVVELSDNSLSGTLGGWFFNLPSLQQVDLANNSFTSIEIWKPTKIESDLVAVDLGFNKLDGYVPSDLSAYPRLSSLSLRYNRLRGPIPSQFSEKATLKRLFLDGNFLNGTPPAGFFSSGTSVSGSLGDNCLQSCPASSQLCSKPQKP
ncbi:Non-specific serine/threonine protein kinase, partial [Bertholletia excelsa]